MKGLKPKHKLRRIKTHGRQFISAMFIVGSKITYAPWQPEGLVSDK